MDNIPSNTWGSPGLPIGPPSTPVSSDPAPPTKEVLLTELGELVRAHPVPDKMKFMKVLREIARLGIDEKCAHALGRYSLELFNSGHEDQAFYLFRRIDPELHPETYKKFTFSLGTRAFAIAYRAKRINITEFQHTSDRLIANFVLDRTHLQGKLDEELGGGLVSHTAPYLAHTISLLTERGGLESLDNIMDSDAVMQMKELLRTFSSQLLEEGFFAGFSDSIKLGVAERQRLSKHLAQRVMELQVDQSILVPMDSTEHALILEIERQLDGKLRVRIYNTGSGIEMHHRDPHSKKKYLTHLTYENIEPKKLQDPRAWAEFVSMRKNIESDVEEWSKTREIPPSPIELIYERVKGHYAEVKKICGNPDPSENVSVNPHAFQRVQIKASCAYQVQLAVLRRRVLDHPAFKGKPNEAYAAYKIIKGLVTHEFSKKECAALRPEVKEALLFKLRMHDKEIALTRALANPESCEKEIEIFNQEIDRANQERRMGGMPTLDEENPPLTKLGPKPFGYSALRYFGMIRGHIKRAADKGLFDNWDSLDCAIKDLVLQRIVRMRDKQFAPPLPPFSETMLSDYSSLQEPPPLPPLPSPP